MHEFIIKNANQAFHICLENLTLSYDTYDEATIYNATEDNIDYAEWSGI